MGPRPDRNRRSFRRPCRIMRKTKLATGRRGDMHETVITRDGFERLSAELEQLTTDGRREVADRLRHAAASESNREENADYLGARDDQALLERRIALLEDRLRSAQVIDPEL